MNIDPAEIRTLIRSATRRTGTPVRDEDLEQEAVLRVLEAFRRVDQIRHPRALLVKIVYDTVRDHWRRKRPSDELENINERFIAHVPALESDIDHERRLELLRLALAQLPASKRTLLELFYMGGHSVAEIASQQGRSVSAVKMQLARSRQCLSRIFQSMLDRKSPQRRLRVPSGTQRIG